MQKNIHWATALSIVMGLVCFFVGSIAGGVIFLGLAIWLELSAALAMARKVKEHVHSRKAEAEEQHE